MDTERDDLMTYEVTFTGLVDDLGDGMSDEEMAAWSEALAGAEYDLWLTGRANTEAAEDREEARLTADLADMDYETLAAAAEEARVMFPDSPWGQMIIAAYEERVAELEYEDED